MFCKNVFLKILQNSNENISARVSFLIKLKTETSNIVKKEAVAPVFSRKFCEIFKNTYYYRTTSVASLQWLYY